MLETILSALHNWALRPLAIIVVHLLILVLVVLTLPLWLLTVFPCFRSGDLALKLIREFRGWSRDITGGGINRSGAR